MNDFGMILRRIQEDPVRAARRGWNSKNMFIYYVPGASYPAQTHVARTYLGPEVPYGAYIALKTSTGQVIPWVPDHPDLLEKDWVILHAGAEGIQDMVKDGTAEEEIA